MTIINFKEIPSDTDDWEFFTRDFLAESGFIIESPPDRGPDQGKDMLAVETIKGKIHSYSFRWLVSCKHYATSERSVNESKDEPNILERIKAFRADGFLGFYSTIASSGLNSRLRTLRENGEIKDYHIFDSRLIEGQLLQLGFSRILSRYFPNSERDIRPVHKVIDEHIPLLCDCCGKDLLLTLSTEPYKAIIAQVEITNYETDITEIKDMYFACKGDCDKELQERCWHKYNYSAGWKDISDLIIPAEFLRYIIATFNRFHSHKYIYNDSSFKKEKHLIMALSQKVFREMTERERERVRILAGLPF